MCIIVPERFANICNIELKSGPCSSDQKRSGGNLGGCEGRHGAPLERYNKIEDMEGRWRAIATRRCWEAMHNSTNALGRRMGDEEMLDAQQLEHNVHVTSKANPFKKPPLGETLPKGMKRNFSGILMCLEPIAF